MCEVNILGLSICTREAVQLMLDKSINDGQIVNISSMSGHRIVPSASTHFYSATKFAVRALTEGIKFIPSLTCPQTCIINLNPSIKRSFFILAKDCGKS